MSTSLSSVGAITLFIEDLQRSTSFYAAVLGRAPTYEDDVSAVFAFDNTIINLLTLPAARELVAPGSVGGADAGPRCQLTIWVGDADAVCAELRAHGVVLLNGPVDREWGMRTASFTDPDGHLWEIAQELPRS